MEWITSTESFYSKKIKEVCIYRLLRRNLCFENGIKYKDIIIFIFKNRMEHAEGDKNQEIKLRIHSTKNQIYFREQDIIITKMFNFLELDDFNSIIRRDLDNDLVKQEKILCLLPEIRKYFSMGQMYKYITSEKCKNKTWTLIKFILKDKPVTIQSRALSYMESPRKQKRTTRYTFHFNEGWFPNYDLLNKTINHSCNIGYKWNPSKS
tara:strand:+ start:8057 stop:8680 length:624 start_codon:yes stop_codon:yes gene_type:complete